MQICVPAAWTLELHTPRRTDTGARSRCWTRQSQATHSPLHGARIVFPNLTRLSKMGQNVTRA